jgi:hypothetical protein
MHEGDEGPDTRPWDRDPPPREPFWLVPGTEAHDLAAFERLAELAEQAEAAAARAAEEAEAQLEQGSVSGAEGADQAEHLRSAHSRLTRLAGDASAIARRLRHPGEPGSGEPAAPESAPERAADESASAGARVLARQLAARGHAPDEIEARLADQFGVRDSRAVVEELTRQGPPGAPRETD